MVYSVMIKGAKWKFSTLPIDKYIQKFGEDSWAVTEKDEKTITFCEGKFNLGLCRHEIYHCFMAECCLGSVPKCDPLIIEEISAELLEHHLDEIDKIAREMFKTLK